MSRSHRILVLWLALAVLGAGALDGASASAIAELLAVAGPVVVLFASLWCGVYPGEDRVLALGARRPQVRRAPRTLPRPARLRIVPSVAVPRGHRKRGPPRTAAACTTA